MGWTVVAEGRNFNDLHAVIADRELPKGTRVKAIMEFSVPGVAKAFDFWGAESAFRPFIPDGLELIDVHEEGGKGIVDMKSDPVWLLAAVAFVKAHWVAIIIGGAVLYLVVKSIKMLADIAGVAGTGIIILLAIVGVAAIYLILRGQSISAIKVGGT